MHLVFPSAYWFQIKEAICVLKLAESFVLSAIEPYMYKLKEFLCLRTEFSAPLEVIPFLRLTPNLQLYCSVVQLQKIYFINLIDYQQDLFSNNKT